MTALLLLPNVGDEEVAPARGPARDAADTVAHLWQLLFAADARRLNHAGDEPLRERTWPSALGPPPEPGVLPEAPATPGLVPWLANERAAAVATERGLPLAAAAPECARRVHDKAFAFEAAREERLDPPPLRGLPLCLDPEDLCDPDAALARVSEHVATWPEWTARRFTLKPRLGSSGRGRVSATFPLTDADVAALRGACARLARQGGALLEPWLERVADLSASLWIERDGTIRLLGTAQLHVDASGLYRGHAGTLDNRGRMTSGSPDDEALREAAALVAVRAAAAGYRGPCGVDAFRFRGESGEEWLRPVVELNARFTLGSIVAGLLRRALPRVKQHITAGPEVQRAFTFALHTPHPLGPATPDQLQLDLSAKDTPLRPTLWIARSPELLANH